MAVIPLLQRHRPHQIVDADLDRLFDHAVDLDGPGPDLQRLRGDAIRFDWPNS